MKFTEQITQPGLIIDLMSALAIFSLLIGTPLFFIWGLPHLLHHHGPSRSLVSIMLYSLVTTSIWIAISNRRKKHKAQQFETK